MPPKPTGTGGGKGKGKATPKSTPTPAKAKGFSILNFFRSSSDSKPQPESSPSPSRTSSSNGFKTTSAALKGKRARDDGSAADPVVISDEEDEDEEGEEGARPAKRIKRERNEDQDIVLFGAGPSISGSSSRTRENSSVACPVCDVALTCSASEVEAHVNACLDGSVPSRPAAHSSTRRTSSTLPSSKPLLKGPSQPPAPKPITSITHRLDSPTPPPSPATSKPGAANAFSVLMSSHKEKEEWKEADVTEKEKRNGGRSGPRKAPFYKILTGMPISVDAFCYGAIPKVTAYFLTHAHSDHYTNLSKSWRHGPIYCSHTTANLVVHMLGVAPQWVHGLPDDTPYVVPDTGGVTVTLIEANHCPGSSLFLFEGPQTVNAGDSSFNSPYVGTARVFRYLHCGDFRACPKHVLHPAVAAAPLDTVYLDTTYLNPQYCFPPQPLVIEACAALARRAALGDELPTEAAVKDEDEDVVPPDEDNVDPDVGMEELGGEAAELDVKPDLDSLDVDVKPELDGLQGSSEANPSGVQFKLEADVKPDIKPEAMSDVKPEVKPDIKPALHPSEIAFAEQDRAAAKMESWLIRKTPTVSEEAALKERKGKTLVLVGTYSIGKERIVKVVAKALGSKIFCNPRKHAILMCQADPELHDMLDADPLKCQVHIVPLNHISLEHLQPYLDTVRPHFTRILAFRPTGWTYRPPAGTNALPDINFVIDRDQKRGFSDVSLKPIRGSSRNIMMFGVPYSEHSSFFELTCFALSVPGDAKIIATVNVHNEKSRLKMRNWFDKWAAEKVRRKDKGQPRIVGFRDETYW